jgi:Spy/CpxP family protein refolding chaperone
MGWITKTRVKYALAGAGAFYIILFVGYLVYAGTSQTAPQGPSELEAHPEKQAEIVSQRRAEELRDQLQLTEEQTRKVADIYLKTESAQSADGEQRGRWREQQKEIDQVLTAEQKAQLEQTRGQFGGPGGPQGQVAPERIESLKQSMTPEQRERFEKAAQRMQQQRGQGGPRGEGQGRERGRGDGGKRPRPQE